MYRICSMLVLLGITVALNPGGESYAQPAQGAPKVALIVVASPSIGTGHLTRAAAYAVRLQEAGVEAQLVFDGIGVRWLNYLLDSQGKYAKGAEQEWNSPPELKGVIRGNVSQFKHNGGSIVAPTGMLKRFGLIDFAKEHGIATAEGGLDIAAYVKSGYQVWIF